MSSAPQKKKSVQINAASRPPPPVDIVQRGSGQQNNFFGGGGAFKAMVNGKMVDMNELFSGKQEDRKRPVLGYSTKVTDKKSGELIKDYFVPLDLGATEIIQGQKGACVKLSASGTPEKPQFSMTIRTGKTTVQNNTVRGQCITDFTLADGQQVGIVSEPIYESRTEKEAPSPKKSKPTEEEKK